MTRLSWNEIRVRAAGFAREWRGASYEKGQAQTFYTSSSRCSGCGAGRLPGSRSM